MKLALAWTLTLSSCFTPAKPAPPETKIKLKQIRYAERLCKKNGGIKELTKDGFICENGLGRSNL